MRCPVCNHIDTKVVDSRPSEDGSSVRRRRQCLKCAHRFTTYERLGENALIVLKSDGTTEVYDREKLSRGIFIACAKRPISAGAVTRLIDAIESKIRDQYSHAISSSDLGTLVLEQLADLDDVAYIRFASVYKDFKNIDEFNAALKELKND